MLRESKFFKNCYITKRVVKNVLGKKGYGSFVNTHLNVLLYEY